MKRLLILATAAFFISGSTLIPDNPKKKAKKASSQKLKAAVRIKAKRLLFKCLAKII